MAPRCLGRGFEVVTITERIEGIAVDRGETVHAKPVVILNSLERETSVKPRLLSMAAAVATECAAAGNGSSEGQIDGYALALLLQADEDAALAARFESSVQRLYTRLASPPPSDDSSWRSGWVARAASSGSDSPQW